MSELHHVISVEELENGKFKSKINFDGELVQKATARAIQVVGNSVQVKGFRKGKAPAKIVKSFHPEKVSQTILQLLVDEGFKIAIKENRIVPFGNPVVTDISKHPHEEDGFEYEIEFNGMTEIDPIGYLNMDLQIPKYNFDESVEEYIKFLGSQHSSLTPIEKIVDGSFIKCDYSINLGEDELGKDQDQLVPVFDNDKTIFGSKLIGHVAGDVVEYEYLLPQDFPENPGKEVTIKISVKEVSEKQNASLKDISDKFGISEEQLVNFSKSEVSRSLERNKHIILNEQIIDKLIELNTFNPPEFLISSEIESLKQRTEQKCCKDGKCDTEKCSNSCSHEHEEKCDAGCCENHEDPEIRKKAERIVKISYILNRIYNMEGKLALTKEEVEMAIDEMAKANHTTPQIIRKQIKDNSVYNNFIGGLRNRKIMSFILSNAIITEKENQGEENGE